ncbi:hypothetical protein IWZ01DRAFT_64155 [Phyllosticta capitalensis]
MSQQGYMQHSGVRRAVDSHGRRERKRIGTTSSSVYRLSRQLAHAQGGDRDWRAGAFLGPERGGLPESIWASYAAICVCEDELLLKRPLHHLPPIAPYHRTPSKPVHSSPSSPHTHHHQLPTPHLLLAATKPSTSLSLTFSAANQPPAPFTVAHPQPTTFVFLPATLRDPFDQHQRHPHPLSFVASRPISCPSPRDRYSSSSRSFCSPSLPAGRRQRASRIHDLIAPELGREQRFGVEPTAIAPVALAPRVYRRLEAFFVRRPTHKSAPLSLLQ